MGKPEESDLPEGWQQSNVSPDRVSDMVRTIAEEWWAKHYGDYEDLADNVNNEIVAMCSELGGDYSRPVDGDGESVHLHTGVLLGSPARIAHMIIIENAVRLACRMHAVRLGLSEERSQALFSIAASQVHDQLRIVHAWMKENICEIAESLDV